MYNYHVLVVQIIFLIAIPFLLLKLESKSKWFKAIVMAYVFGVAIGNIFPKAFDLSVVKEITGISIILAIPLMLFPTSISNLIKQPKTLLLSYVLAVVATTTSVFVGYWIFKDSLDNIAFISGMVEGVYTGGTVNLNAIGYAFEVDQELIILMNGFDWSLSGIYLLLIFTVLPRILGFVLPNKPAYENSALDSFTADFKSLERKDQVVSILKGLGLSGLLLGLMAGVSVLIYGDMNELILIFGVTGLGLALSSIKRIQRLEANMITADYLMLLFGFTLGLQANISELFSDRSDLFYYFVVTYTMMFLIHLVLAKIFKVDVQSFLISSSAAVFGPPFIGPIAESLNNRNLITPGIIIALLGNAMGTYLGILIVKLLLEE